MGLPLLRVAHASQQPQVEQVIGILQRLRYSITAGNALVTPSLPVVETQWNQNEALNIGLAISGGVDSMALAYLCSKLQACVGDPARLRFHAFVVDHGVRLTSEEEACSVAKILESQNIPTSVLKIEWPAWLDAQSSPKFESLARTFRFQALGRACRDHNINSLFLAHHEDDQAETLLMRLAKGHRRRGLLGMNASAPIPECHGIYGVDRSGGKHHPRIVSGTTGPHLDSEDGGVMVHRPLLDFTKAQLREVCEKNEMPWFEDHTNSDPKITTRNALRHIYAKHRLPAALQKPSLLAMLGRLQKQKEESIRARRDSWSSKLHVQQFDERLPLLLLKTQNLSHEEVMDDKAIPILLEMLKSKIQIISSVEDIDIASLLPALLDIIPELRSHVPPYSGGRDSYPVSCKFTKAGVQFTRQVKAACGATTWLLTPQKAYRNRAPYLRIPPRPAASLDDQMRDPESWNLWDGRYWINVSNQAPRALRLQQLGTVEARSPDAVQHNQKLLLQLERIIGKDVVASWAEGRHALPTITTEIDGKCTGRIVALPTLGIIDDEYKGAVECMVRYKRLDSNELY